MGGFRLSKSRANTSMTSERHGDASAFVAIQTNSPKTWRTKLWRSGPQNSKTQWQHSNLSNGIFGWCARTRSCCPTVLPHRTMQPESCCCSRAPAVASAAALLLMLLQLQLRLQMQLYQFAGKK